jgi:hypothetical protein
MVIGNPNTVVKDRHYLWKDFQNKNFERPYMHGVVGPQWQVPVSEANRGFNHIASPMPRPDSPTINRIIANELPPVTYSPSSFDMPMRKDVVQADIPFARIRTVEQNIDPRFPPKKPVARVSGTLYHGTGSVDAKVVHGLPSFIEKKAKKNHSHRSGRRHHLSHCSIKKQVDSNKAEALANAKAAESKAENMLYSVTNNPAPISKMVLGVDLLNRYEQPSLKLHEHNSALHNRIERLRHTPAGVRAAHTFRKLP